MPSSAKAAHPDAAARTVSHAIYEQLRTLIVRGRLLPGTRLTEIDVADQLGASRTPAREALRRLRQEGLLVPTGPQNGAKIRLAVASMTSDEATELYHAAGAIEGVIARAVGAMGVQQRGVLAERLRKAEDAFQREARRRKPDWDRMFELHDKFHRVLVDALAGPRLRALLEVLRPHVDRYEYFYGPLLGPDFSVTFAEHAAIIRAVASGDAEVAESAVRSNWFNGAERLASVVRKSGKAGFLRGLASLGAPLSIAAPRTSARR